MVIIICSKMVYRMEAFPAYVVLTILINLIYERSSLVQAGQGIIKSTFDAGGSGLLQNGVRMPRQTYIARILDDKPKPIPQANSGHELPVSKGNSTEEDDVDSSSSSSSEEYDETSTVAPALISLTRDTVTKKSKVELLAEATVQQTGRQLKPKQPERGHNWYSFSFKNAMQKQGKSIATRKKKGSDEDEGSPKAVREVKGDEGGGDFAAEGGSEVNSTAALGGGKEAGSGAASSSGKEAGGGGADISSGTKDGNSISRGASKTGGPGTTGKKPYNVIRAKPSSLVDPDSYNFFQFKPLSRFGWLWLTKAKLGGRINLNLLLNDDGNDVDDTDPASKYDWEFRRYDRACLYVEYKKQKTLSEIPAINEDLRRIVEVQNEGLARRFLDWHFVAKEGPEAIALQEEGNKHPLYLTYKFLLISMELFRDKICRNATSYAVASAIFAPTGAITRALPTAGSVDTKLLPNAFVEDLFRLFLALREATRTKNVPDYATTLDEEEVLQEVLLKCQKEEPNVQWYSHSCADQILSNDQPNNFACTPLVDYDYNPKIYDPILDGMWHMFNSVHSYCFKHFNQINTRLWHRYAMIIANSYTVGMRQRWIASVTTPKFFTRLLGPDHEVHLETMNRCMFSTVVRSNVPAIIPRFDTLSPITFGMERMIHKDGAAR